MASILMLISFESRRAYPLAQVAFAEAGLRLGGRIHQKVLSMDLLLNTQPAKTIEEVAQEIFVLFGIEEFNERFSCHYVDDHYFVGNSDRLAVKIMLSDDEDHADLPIWVSLESCGSGDNEELACIEPLIIELQVMGYSVARIEKFGLKGEKRIDY